MTRPLIKAAGWLFAPLVAAELILQIAAFAIQDRSNAFRAGAEVRILCVGDSHTYGGGVESEESYPAQLQLLLDEAASGHYSVLNLGVPGMSTTQVLHRLDEYAQRYDPDWVLIWVGVNNMWNRAEIDEQDRDVASRLDTLLYRSRLYRLVRSRANDRKLEPITLAANAEAPLKGGERSDRFGVGELEKSIAFRQVWTVRHGDFAEQIDHGQPIQANTRAEYQEAADRAKTDYRRMMKWGRKAEVEIRFLTYPSDSGEGWFNTALKNALLENGDLVIQTGPAVERLPAEKRKFLWAMHPNAFMYAEIAVDVAKSILAGEESSHAGE